jgi:hypothetical protein
MSKGKKNRNFGKVKSKEKPVFELVNGILKGVKKSPDYLGDIRQNFIDFTIKYKGKNFTQVYTVLLKDEYFCKVTPILNLDFEEKISEMHFDDISLDRLFELLLTPLKLFADPLTQFENKKNLFEKYLFNGLLEQANEELKAIELSMGTSVWLVRAKMLLYTFSGQFDALHDLLDNFKREGIKTDINRTISTYVSLFEIADPKLLLKDSIVRDCNEFLDGEALDLVAINSLLFLPFPSIFNVHPFYSLKGLQQFNYVDLYVYLKEILIQVDIRDRSTVDTSIDSILKPRVTKVIASIDRNWNMVPIFSNKHMEWYQSSSYENIIDDLEANKYPDNILVINLNIYAKSYVYLKRLPNDGLSELLKLCLENLINIYQMRDVQQSLSSLNSLVINSIFFDISRHIQIAIEKVLNYQSSANKRLRVSLSAKYTNLGGTEASYFLMYAPNTAYKHGVLSLKDKAKANYLNSPCEESLKAYISFNPIKKDLVEVKATKLLSHNEFEELLDFAVDEMMENELSYICFPMEKISSFIVSNHIETESAVIFYYYYCLLIDKDSSEFLNQIFEEFILEKGIERPGSYFDLVENLSEKELFVLSEVAKISVMDYMGCFTGTSDLMYERIRILNNLKFDTRTNNDKLEIEYQEILNEILVQDVTAKLTTAKIFVDKKSIVKVNRGKLSTLVNRFFDAKTDYKTNMSDENIVIINNALVDLYQLIMSEYLNNQEYGLDSNLSGEIRHTFFNNLLSTKPEDNHIITEIGASGDYKSNTYWLNEYSIVNPKITKEMDLRLSQFSQSFNELIETVENWMKVSVSDSKPERIFIFKNPELIFESLMNKFLQSDSLEQLVSIIFDSLDSQLNDCLKEMRIKMNHDFAIALDDLFDDLLSDIHRLKQSTSLTNLVTNILNAKNLIKEDVKTASEWFNFRNKNTFSSYPITEVIKISERCFRLGSKNERRINLVNEENIEIEGPFVPKFIMALNNCYANAKKYAECNEQIEIKLKCGEAGSYSVTICNSISMEHENYLLSGELMRRQEKLKAMDSNSLLTKEGGTGLYKSKHKLLTMSEKFDLKIDVKNCKFVAEVIFNA